MKIIGSDPMFGEDDVRTTTAKLPRLLRLVFLYFGITNDGYVQRYNRYYHEKPHDGKSFKEFCQKVASDRKVMKENSKLTFTMLESVLRAMGYEIESVTLVIRERVTNTAYTVSTNDSVETINDKLRQEREIGVSSIV